MVEELNRRLGRYLEKFIDVEKGHTIYEEDVIWESIGLLVAENVFTARELQKNIIKECSIFIPIEDITKIAFDGAIGADVTVFLDLIKEQPTAFDAEKVIEELEDSKFWVASEIKDGDGFVEDYYNQEVIDIEKATEIVEKGGL